MHDYASFVNRFTFINRDSQNVKMSPDETNTAHGSFTKTFRQSQMSFPIRKGKCMWTHSKDYAP